MQVRLLFWCPVWMLGCGCVASKPHSEATESSARDARASGETADTSLSDADADADADADVDGESAPASSAFDGAQMPPRDRDGASSTAEAGRASDAGAACSGDACSAQPDCDEDHPCSAPDEVCVAHDCKPDPQAPPASWLHSTWSGRVGSVDADDTTRWCTPKVSNALPNAQDPARVTGQFERVALDGSTRSALGAPRAAQRVRFQCFAEASGSGPSTLITSAWSTEAEQHVLNVRCPRERPYAAFARCQIAVEGKPPLVYAGPTCGDGVTGLSEKARVRGQLLGDHYELTGPSKPLFNNTGKAAVMGTDLGFQFLAQGRMYVGFGDTWENELSFPGPNGYRGSVLAHTHDFDPADDNGIALEGWEATPDRPEIAREVIPSAHDQSGRTEFTAIAAAGFGLSEGAAHYRFLWFAAIKQWDPFVNNESTLAWSENGGTFTRGDQAPSAHPPRWPFASYFGPGAIWVDREHGYVYFFGVRTYQAGFPVRLARVRATRAAVLDHREYEYWTGSAWQHPDPKDEYALARLEDAAANLVPASSMQNNRPEFSVAYNPYVGRFIMMLQNDATPFQDEGNTQLELWQAEAIEGPWTRASTGDQLTLPAHHYGPYMSEQTLSDGGRELYFALSEWNLLPLSLGQPYVVGLWNMRLERRVRPGCTP